MDPYKLNNKFVYLNYSYVNIITMLSLYNTYQYSNTDIGDYSIMFVVDYIAMGPNDLLKRIITNPTTQ